MIRKVSKIGPSTLMVSLPTKWVKANNVKKGDELDLIEDGKRITINLGHQNGDLKTKTVETHNIVKSLKRVAGALYKSGYDQITFVYNTPEELKIIQKTMGRSFIGFEIIGETKNSITIKRLSRIDNDDFEIVLKRCFFSLIQMAENCIEALENQNPDDLQKVVLSDDSINKYCDFCRRILNKNQFSGTKKEPPLYVIVEQLEKIGDKYRDIANIAIKNNIKISKDFKQLFNQITNYLRDYSSLYNKFDYKKLEKFIKDKKELKNKFAKLSTIISKEENILFLYLNTIFEILFDLQGPLITSMI
ncbi:PhoU domain-containing protein [Nanoarchaeota archaeon]